MFRRLKRDLFSSVLTQTTRHPAASGPTTILYDTFTDADATSLDAHTISPTNAPATSWTALSGTWTIDTNQVKIASNAINLITCDAGKADVTITLKLPVAKSTSGIAPRTSATNNGWIVEANKNNSLKLNEVSGSITMRAQDTSCDVKDNDTLTVITSGQTISATAGTNGSVTYASATRNQTVTRHGMYIYFTTNRVDEFKVVG